MTVTEFVAARLNEDDAIARAADSYDFRGDVHKCMYLADEANHMRRHDPARVLRQVTAIRAILAMHRPYDTTDPPPAQRCYVCASDHAYRSGAAIQEEWPCVTVRTLAAIWADHEQYEARWKP